MPKKNVCQPQKGPTYIERQKIKQNMLASYNRRFAIQYCMDGVALAANEHFGISGESLVLFMSCVGKWIMRISEATLEDARDDREIIYTKHQIDGALKEVLPPENFLPWDERFRATLEE